MGRTEETTQVMKERMLQALEKSLGVVSTAAQIARIGRSTHYKWVNEDEQYAAAVKEMEEVALDFTESKLFKNIEKGKETSIIFYLKTRGKKRGYIERLQLEDLHPPQPLEVEIVTSRNDAKETDQGND